MTETQKELVEKNHNLIYAFLHQYNLTIEEYYDLAAIGLCVAAINYDSTKSQFSTYAYQCMMTKVFIEKRKQRAAHRIPEAMMTSYDAELQNDNGETSSYLEYIPANNNVENEVLSEVLFEEFEKQLSDRDKQIFLLFKEGYKQIEIGKIVGCSQAQVSRIKKKLERYLEK